MKTIVLCGGGTAGHIYPALAVAEKLQNYKIHFFGGNGMEKEILKKYPKITYHEIPTVKFERKLTFKNLLIPFKLFHSIHYAKKELKKVNPDIIFSKGGYVSVPVVFAAKKLKVPIISHESDLSLGLANKLILKKCNVMCTTFAETEAKNKECIHTGQPIREKIYHGKKQNFFQNNKPTILVLGGSLGAQFLNNIVFCNIDKLTNDYNIIHICGKRNYKDIKHPSYKIIDYAENIEDLYASSDMAIARAGSGVINELLSLSIPMLLIPLSKKCSRGDQIENAKNFVKNGYAQMLEEEQYSYNILKKRIDYIAKNIEKYKQKMKKVSKNHATDTIFYLIEKMSK